MKKTLTTILMLAILLTATIHASAQAWDKSTKVLSLNLGGAEYFHVYHSTDIYGYDYRGYTLPFTGQLNFEGEFGVHQYVGVGFTVGIGGRDYSYGVGEVAVPIGLLANFHFFQLIADKTGKDIHADKLDVYFGLNAGSGIAALTYKGEGNNGKVTPLAYGGFQAGVRYYITPKIGVGGEVGFGKSIINGGVSFKL